jgi:hypothetical protein
MFDISVELATGWVALVAVALLTIMAGTELSPEVKPDRADDPQHHEGYNNNR